MLACLNLKKAKHESVPENYKQVSFKSDSPGVLGLSMLMQKKKVLI